MINLINFKRLLLILFIPILLVGCNPGSVETTKDNALLNNSNPAGQVPVFSYLSNQLGYELGSPLNLAPTVTYSGSNLIFSISGVLPAGLSFDPLTGGISGIPTAPSQTTSFTITAMNLAGSSQKVIVIDRLASFSYATTLNSFQLGVPFSISPSINFAGNGLIFSTNGTLPAGLSLNPINGTISGTPTATSQNSSFTIIGSNAAGHSQKVIVIDHLPILSYSSSAGFELNSPFLLSPSVTYAGHNLNFSITGTLPAGLSLNSSTGVISGTPTAASPSTSFTITGTNSAGSIQQVVVLDQVPGFSYGVSSFIFAIGTPVTVAPTITHAGSNLAFSISGTLPAGLSFNSLTGSISGTPTASSQDSSFTITASNTAGSSQQVIVLDQLPSFDYGTNAAAIQIGTTFSLTPTISYAGSNLNFSISGILPAGLSFNSANGEISGTPLATSGNTSFTITATNSAGSTQKNLIIDHAPIFSFASGPFGYHLGSFFYLLPTVSYGGTNLTFSISGTLPAGLNFEPTIGFIYGLPTASSATTSFTITATNSAGSSMQVITLDRFPDFTYGPNPLDYILGTYFSITPTINHPTTGPYQFAISPALPQGLTMDPSAGVISGIPSAVSANTIYTVTLTSNGLTSSATLTLNDATPPDVSYITNTTYQHNTGLTIIPLINYLGSGASFSLHSGQLPGGVSLNPTTGIISGIPLTSINQNGSSHIIVVQIQNNKGHILRNISLEEVGPPRVTYPTTLRYYRRGSAGLQVDLSAPVPTITPNISFCKGTCNFTPPNPIPEINVNPSNGEITNLSPISYDLEQFSVDISSADPSTVTKTFNVVEVCNATGTVFPGQDFGGGGGTEIDPWLLCKEAHFAEINTNSNFLKDSFKMMSDIDFLNYLTPIGYINPPQSLCFNGNFDGNGKILSGITIENVTSPSTYNLSGLFACLQDFGTIKNLTILRMNSENFSSSAAALAGRVFITASNTPNLIKDVSVYQTSISNFDINYDPANPNPFEGAVGGLVGIVGCPVGVGTLMMSNNIYHGELNHNNNQNSGAWISGLGLTIDSPNQNCVEIKNNAVFMMKNTYPTAHNFGPNPISTIPPSFDVTNFSTLMTNQPFNNPFVDQNIVADLSSPAFPNTNQLDPETLGLSSISNELEDPQIWMDDHGFGNGDVEYRFIDPASSEFSNFTTGNTAIIVPLSLCKKFQNQNLCQ